MMISCRRRRRATLRRPKEVAEVEAAASMEVLLSVVEATTTQPVQVLVLDPESIIIIKHAEEEVDPIN